MRFVALALILVSLPVFVSLLRQYRGRRDWALMALGVMLFLHGSLQIDAAILSWPLWPGIAKGILLSPIDTLSLALILTRVGPKSRLPYLGLPILFLLALALSLFVSFNSISTLFVPLQFARILLMFAAIAGEMHRPSALRSLFAGVAIGLLIQGGFVIEQKLSGIVQAKGTIVHQNILGMMVEMSVIPLLALVMEGDRRKLIYAGIIAGIIIVVAGGSRATMAFTAAGLALMLLLSLIRNVSPRKMKIAGIFTLAAVVVVPLSLGTLGQRFGEGSISIESDAQRPAFERAAKAMSKDYPFGVGANNYVTVANTQGYSLRAGVSWGGNNLAAPVHNSYLLMRAETGWFGEIVMIIVLIVPIFGGLRFAFTARKSPFGAMGLATATVMIVTAIHCFYEYAWHIEAVQRIFFTNLAVLSGSIVASRIARRAQFKERARQARAAALDPA
jgi:hypothetical protein